MRIDISHQTRHTPPNMLPREQNCVAMALSACFRQQLNPVVNSLLKERIIHSPKELEHDNAVISVLQKLQIQEVCNSTLWETAKQQLLQKPDGRYFAINSKHLDFPGSGESHAFCCIKYKNAIGINGNNAETQSTHYQPYPYDKVSIWGPFPHNLT
ncbi:hypothetical protein GAV71_23950 [Salmonella enterica subsp. enterica serovar Typhimurium]|uniref:Uncharacterized protein n=10 Tax=Enterobacterales TaxID=91347 RepID=A0A749QNI2_SALER|nr:hypothetical protein [Salmonella enterica subsp. enterica serovar Typhimurium]EAM8135532.1 hypothetical protein [Salmonella enterica]EBY7672390.1 hypothetical protein [Salmonella enterica subsp. enterica serovar Weltevreden]ECH9064863.1 hypothetical protein [Salmonella enterica subsp. enterica]EGZ4355050.1 hypothetical protein [Salmonella enterica subsp. enterica serovar Copenhagen]PVL72580.1 hypothetical protein C4795_24155 [Salmonella enterica subsp. enterica serovar Newport]HAR9412034.1